MGDYVANPQAAGKEDPVELDSNIVERHERCSIGGSPRAKLKYHYFHRFFTYSVKRRAGSTGPRDSGTKPRSSRPSRGAVR